MRYTLGKYDSCKVGRIATVKSDIALTLETVQKVQM